jgi:hypothetical protein
MREILIKAIQGNRDFNITQHNRKLIEHNIKIGEQLLEIVDERIKKGWK